MKNWKDYKRTTDAPYTVSFSKLLKHAVEVVGADLTPMIEQLVDQFETDPELNKSLKEIPPPGGRYMRQVDIRPEPGSSIVWVKTFVSWSHKANCWYVMVEGAEENIIEGKAL